MFKRLYLFVISMLCLAAQPAPAADAPLPTEVAINGVEFVLVPEGWFWLSVESPDFDNGGASRKRYRDVRIWLDAYYIGKYEARATDFARFMNARTTAFSGQYRDGRTEGCSVRADDSGTYYLVAPEADLPVTHLSWSLADDLARWMGFRLPSEAEWQKAARGTDKRTWPWGDTYPDDTFAGYARRSGCSAGSVTAFPKGVSPYGAYNMAGNAYEYVADWYNQDYFRSLRDGMRNPKIPDRGTTYQEEIPKPVKILKGGRWGDHAHELTVHTRRLVEPNEDGFVCYGTRYAIDVAVVREHLRMGTAEVIKP